MRFATILSFVLFTTCPGFSAFGQAGVKDSVAPAVKELLDSRKYRKYEINKLEWKGSSREVYDIELQKKQKLIFLEVTSDGEVVSKEKGKEFIYDNTKEELRERDRSDDIQAPPPMPRL